LIACPLCKSQKTVSVYKIENMFFTDGRTSMDLEVGLCEECGFVFQSSAYSDEYDAKVANLYKNYHMSDNFDFPRRDKKSLDSLEFICRNVELNGRSSILEIGSDRGDFLYMLKEKYGANILGIEPNAEQVALVPTVKGYFDKDSFSSKFDLVVLKHTLEHIKYPQVFLRDVFGRVNDGGYIYIEVPSFDVCRKYFLDDFTAEHVSYFSQDVLLGLLKDYEVIALDNSHFLRVIVKKTSGTHACESAGMDISGIKQFFEELGIRLSLIEDKIIVHTKAGGKVVFYGVGLYFRILFGKLEGKVDKSNCYFYDDGFADETERSFGLERVDIAKLDVDKALVVFCSNDYKTQDAMNERFAILTKEYEPILFCRTNLTNQGRSSGSK